MKQLMKVISFSGLAVFIKILTSLVSVKLIAIYTGPSGVAVLGQFATICSILSVIAGGGISLGVIKYVAEFKHLSQKFQLLLHSASAYTSVFCFLTLLLGTFFSRSLSYWIFGTDQYRYLIIFISIAQVVIAFNLLAGAVLNGLQHIRKVFFSSIFGSFLGLGVLGLMTIFFGLEGALYGLILSQVVPVIGTIGVIYSESWIKNLCSFQWSKKTILALSRYSLMNIVSTLSVPIAFVIVRHDMSALFGWQAVGYWQAVSRISDAYLMVVTTILTVYYLPRLSSTSDFRELKKEMTQVYSVLLPMIGIAFLGLFLFRDWVLLILYSKAFSPSRELFLYQLIGDFFRISAWVFTYLLIAKTKTKWFIITEILLSVLFVIGAHVMTRIWGLIGVTYAFAIVYAVYWILMASVISLIFREKKVYVVA